jgi:hypothetical protein
MVDGVLNLDVFHVEPLLELLESVVGSEKADPLRHAVLLL